MSSSKNSETIIRVRGLHNRFGMQIVHEDLDLDVRKGEILGVVGGSGTGKSVLMKSIINLIQPQSGMIEIFGKDQSTLSEDEKSVGRRRQGVMFQDGALFSSLTVSQNIQAPLKKYFDLSKNLLHEVAALKISLVGLPALAGPKYPSELSGGMRKRAGLARALAMDPEIVFLDEPTAGLDPIGASKFDQLIRQLKETLGLTVFLVTHDLDTLHAVCDRIAVLADKRVIVVGTIKELIEFDHPWVREYFCGARARAAGIES